jgi:hypothetical protein
MFLINNSGRVVDLPARMEKRGFLEAKEVLSISSQLMNEEPMGVSMTVQDAIFLKQRILSKFPNVITDEEYLEQHPVKLPKKELVNADLTKKEIVKTAKENGIILDSKEERLVKDKLIELVNERHNG